MQFTLYSAVTISGGIPWFAFNVSVSLAALLAFGTLAVLPIKAQISAVPNSMNFQGRLATPSGNPVPDGNYNVRFSLHDALTAGAEKYSKTIANVAIKNGTFAITLDALPANTFNGNLWLQIKIGTDAALAPRTPLVSVPYAIKSDLALTVPDGSLAAVKFAANFFNSTAWLLGGNSATNPATQFLGTTDNQPLNLRVNNRRAMRYSYSENVATAGSEYRSMNVLGGSSVNSIGANVVGATLAGGGQDFFNGTAFANTITGDFGTVSGGINNSAGAYSATVGGGAFNSALAYASTSSGGYFNLATGLYATTPGGYFNRAAGQYSFAAGRRAKANHDGTFVWADHANADFASIGPQQFIIRAANGVGINTNNPNGFTLNVNGDVIASTLTVSGSTHVGGNLTVSGNQTINGTLTVGNVPFGDYRNLQINGNTGRLYYDNSSRKHKQNITPLVDDFDKLLQAVPVTYTRPNAPGRWEIGFIAEDFHDLGLKKLVDYGQGGEVEGINYEKICLYLTAIAKKQNDRLSQA